MAFASASAVSTAGVSEAPALTGFTTPFFLSRLALRSAKSFCRASSEGAAASIFVIAAESAISFSAFLSAYPGKQSESPDNPVIFQTLTTASPLNKNVNFCAIVGSIPAYIAWKATGSQALIMRLRITSPYAPSNDSTGV